MWQEVVVPKFKVLFRHFTEGIEKNDETFLNSPIQDILSGCLPKLRNVTP